MSRLVNPNQGSRKYNDWRDYIDWNAVKVTGPIVLSMIVIAIVVGVST